MADNTSQQAGVASGAESTSPVKDILLAWYKEHADQIRQHENLRERMTNLIVLIGTSALGLAVAKVPNIRLWPFGLLLIVLGVYGAAFSYKHSQRIRIHRSLMRRIRKRLSDLYPDQRLSDLYPTASLPMPQAEPAKQSGHRSHRWIRLNWLWLGLCLIVSLIGLLMVVWELGFSH